MSKPDVDSIDGLSPAVSIDQKTTSKNPRSTVGTTTEIYDYLRLLFARVGVPHRPRSAASEIKKQTHRPGPTISCASATMPRASRRRLSSWPRGGRPPRRPRFADLQKEGFSRVRIDGDREAFR